MLLPTFKNMFNSLSTCRIGCRSIILGVRTIFSATVAFSAMVLALTILGSTGITIFIDTLIILLSSIRCPLLETSNKNVVKTGGGLQDYVAGKRVFLWFHTIWNILNTYTMRSGGCEYNQILCNAIASSRVKWAKHKTVKSEKVTIHQPKVIQYLQWVNQELCMYHDLFIDVSFAEVPLLYAISMTQTNSACNCTVEAQPLAMNYDLK